MARKETLLDATVRLAHEHDMRYKDFQVKESLGQLRIIKDNNGRYIMQEFDSVNKSWFKV